MKPIPPPDPPYEGPAAHTSPGPNLPATRVVIHSTVSPCEPGGRHDIARYFRSEASGGSAHYVTDPVGVVQVVGDHTIAWHAPPNPHSLGIEMCDIPGPVPGDNLPAATVKALRHAWRWRRPNQDAMLHVTAQLAAHLCASYGIPPRYVGARALRAGQGHGVTTHAAVSRAFGQSTHWDPGFWPRRRFMRLVRRYHRELVLDHMAKEARP